MNLLLYCTEIKIVDPEWMNEGQLSIPETLCLLWEKVNHLTPTIQNLWVLTNTLEWDPCKHAMTVPRIPCSAEWPHYTEKTAKRFHNMKPLSHNMKPVYDMLVQTNMLNAMTNTTSSIFPWSHSTDSWKTAKGNDLTFCQSIHGNIAIVKLPLGQPS